MLKAIYQPPTRAEARLKALTTDGRVVEIQEIIYEPLFGKPDESVSLGAFEVRDERGRTIHSYLLKLSGKKATLTLIERKPVRSRYDLEMYGDDALPTQDIADLEDVPVPKVNATSIQGPAFIKRRAP